MKRESKTQYAILGILSQCEMSGYEIKKFVENSLGFFWNESFGQIYPNLKNMEELGWVTSIEATAEETNKTKIVYTITELGLKELKNWLETSTTNITIRNELLLKVFFGRNMDKEKFILMLKSIESKLKEELKVYQSIHMSILDNNHNSTSTENTGSAQSKRIRKNQESHPDMQYWLYTLDYGMESTKAGIKWIESVIRDQMKSVN